MIVAPDIGKSIPRNIEREIEEFVLGITNWQRTIGFPGTYPVTLTYADIKKSIQRKRYYVSEKCDGFRYLLLIHQKETFMIDPTFRIRSVTMKFPSGSNPLVPQHQTLLDGELVYDKIAQDNKFVPRFLVYDIIAYCGQNVMGHPLPERLKLIQNEVIRPRKLDTSHDYSSEPFSIRLKDFYEVKHTPWVLNELIPALPHPNEGLVFTPLDLPYVPGYNRQLFKWKPPSLNSVDFQLGTEWRNRKPCNKLLILSSDSGTLKDYCFIHFSEDTANQLSQSEGKIIECVWDNSWKTFIPKKGEETWEEGATWQDGGWRFLRLRLDKKYPNDERTIEIVLKSISDNLNQEKLLKTLFSPNRERGNYRPKKRPRDFSPKRSEEKQPNQENAKTTPKEKEVADSPQIDSESISEKEDQQTGLTETPSNPEIPPTESTTNSEETTFS